MPAETRNTLVILGPTAAGKTALGVFLARRFSGEIISADSRQVYQGLDIGSGKDLCEYGEIPYHLINVAELPGEYSVFNFQRDFFRILPEITARGKLPVVVGGTGMYLDAILRGYRFREVPANEALRAELAPYSLAELASSLLEIKNEIHNRTDLVERPRLVRAIEIAEYERTHGEPAESEQRPVRALVLGVRFDRAELRSRIKSRLDSRLVEGLVTEVRSIHESGISWERLERLGLEYRFAAEYIQGKIETEKEFIDLLYIAICQFAKRQETWFRGMERKGVAINWIDRGNPDEAAAVVARYFPQ